VTVSRLRERRCRLRLRIRVVVIFASSKSAKTKFRRTTDWILMAAADSCNVVYEGYEILDLGITHRQTILVENGVRKDLLYQTIHIEEVLSIHFLIAEVELLVFFSLWNKFDE